MEMWEIEETLKQDKETNRIECKQSESWNELKFHIIKTCLAMANLQDGGYIIIGVEEDDGNGFLFKGINEEHLKTYDLEQIKDKVDEYADPSVEIFPEITEYNNNKYIKIRIKQFSEIPIICKNNSQDLQKGIIYSRPKGGRARSVPVPNSNEMRSILNIAIDYGITQYLIRQDKINQKQQKNENDYKLFNEEIRGI